MGKDTGIGWCHHTFNGWRGCIHKSTGCLHCFAEVLSKRNPAVLGQWGPPGIGTRIVAAEAQWREVLKWDREAKAAGERRRVFSASLSDVFEDWPGPMTTSKGDPYWWCYGSLSNSPIPSTGLPEGCHLATMDDIRERLFQLIADTPNLDWLLLTKRPENLDAMLPWTSAHAGMYRERFWENVWLGVSCENQESADERIPILLSIPAAIRWVSAEPLLGPIRFRPEWFACRSEGQYMNIVECGHGLLSWGVVGGESGPHRRPMQLDWLNSIVAQCIDASVPVYVKQDSAFKDGQQGRIPASTWAIKQFPVQPIGA